MEGAERADICIVGGGYAGMWTALEIKKRNPALDVAIIEADICGGGASGRNSGMVLSQWAKFAALKAFCGEEGALRLGEAFGKSADNLEKFCAENGIDAEFRRDGWIWGATCAKHVGSWKGIIETLAKSGVHPFRELSKNADRRALRHHVFPGGHLRSDRRHIASRKTRPRFAPRCAEQGCPHLRELADDAA